MPNKLRLIITMLSLITLGAIPAFSYMEMVTHDLFGYLYISDAWDQGYRYAAGEVSPIYTQITGLRYFTRPPLYPLLLWLTSHLFGRNLFSISLVTLIPRMFLPLTAFLWLRKITTDVIAYAGASMTVFMVSYQTYSLASFEADSLFAVLLFAALIFLGNFNRKPTKRRAVLLGATAGLASITKEVGVVIAVVILANALTLRKLKHWRLASLSVSVMVAIYSSYILLAWPTSYQLYFSSQYGASAPLQAIIRNVDHFVDIIQERYLILNWTGPRPTLISGIKLALIVLGVYRALHHRVWSIPLAVILGIISFSTIDPQALAGGVESLRHMNFTIPLIIGLYALGIDSIHHKSRILATALALLLTIKTANEHIILHAKMGPPQYYVPIWTLYQHPFEFPLIPASGTSPVGTVKRDDLIIPRVSLSQYYSAYQSAEDVYTTFYVNSIRLVVALGMASLIRFRTAVAAPKIRRSLARLKGQAAPPGKVS